MRLRRGPVLHLEPAEAAVLDELFGEVEPLLSDSGSDPAADVAHRLFPDAYPDDPGASAEFRSLTSGAGGERAGRLAACRRQLSEAGAGRGRCRVDLSDPADADAWIRALNEVRLVLGTRLGVSAEDDRRGSDPDPTDPVGRAWLVYDWLTAVQDGLVTAVMG